MKVNAFGVVIDVLCLIFLCGGMTVDSPASETEEEIVNPHWTGKYCSECHLEDNPQGKGAALRFDGDSVKLCNRCHETEFARTDNHPVGVALLEEMKKTMPETFPLDDGKLSCLTCHDVLSQMKDDYVLKQTNPKFIRGAPFEVLATFCFFCHKQEEYKKTNPHKQLDESGKIVEARCLFCHQSAPDPDRVKSISEVSFKATLSLYCVNCHFKQKTRHPARADHLVALPDFLKEYLPERLKAQHADLPLDGDRIFCGTCHNPHEKGVIRRAEAAAGAGADYFLRLNGGYDLCVTCHRDKELKRGEGALRMEEGLPPGLPQELISSHKPVAENRCKICHAITAESRDRPRALELCFKTDCHKTEMLNQAFVHEKTVGENCYLCHGSHSSTYEKLLRFDKEKMCLSCHPLMRDTTGRLAAVRGENNADAGLIKSKEEPRRMTAQKAGDISASESASTSTQAGIAREAEGSAKEPVSIVAFEKSSREHVVFNQFLLSTPVPRGRECGFCHSQYHKKEIGGIAMEDCAQCHTFVREMRERRTDAPLNIHDTFQKKSCTACHDPHAAPYKHVLKQPVETYLPKLPRVSSQPPEKTF